MAVIGNAVGSVLKGLGIISTPKPVNQTALPQATRDDADATISSEDALRRRQGGAADIITGAAGAGAPLTGGKLTLGS